MDKPGATFNPERDFKYRLDGNLEAGVLSLCGTMFSKEIGLTERHFLMQMEEQLFTRFKTQIIILNFAHAYFIRPNAYSWLTGLQKTIRDANRIYALCGLRSELKRPLIAAGVIKESDLFKNISEAFNGRQGQGKA